jgi:hypothetical protein
MSSRQLKDLVKMKNLSCLKSGGISNSFRRLWFENFCLDRYLHFSILNRQGLTDASQMNQENHPGR